ncbi:MAG: YbaB/EbfC family nucleoid-associated protein [Acidobacteria bacterium]|nr:YbaB/EbfC family nucleoid-associated protein [Acidobacteriota bacterium]
MPRPPTRHGCATRRCRVKLCRPCSTCSRLKSGTSKRSHEPAARRPTAVWRYLVNIQQMMKQAQEMQARMQKQAEETVIEATAGGGAVTVQVNGSKQLLSIVIDPDAVSREDVEILQDMILLAVTDAQRKADEAMSQSVNGMMGGLKLPGM